eukprot:3120961-Rhodomonas_salina.1
MVTLFGVEPPCDSGRSQHGLEGSRPRAGTVININKGSVGTSGWLSPRGYSVKKSRNLTWRGRIPRRDASSGHGSSLSQADSDESPREGTQNR